MASSRALIATAVLLAGAGGAYWYYNADAVQATGALAQVPLNSGVVVPPAFVMAVDNSGSMTFQTLFPGQDGAAFWEYDARGTNGFFVTENGVPRLRTRQDITNNGDWDSSGYHHTIPSPDYRIGGDRHAIPPIDNFGFARSSDYNPAYFNPNTAYPPWKRADGNNIVDYPNASTSATQVDPDSTANTIALASWWTKNDSGDQYFRVPNGATLPKGTVYYVSQRNGCGGLDGRYDDKGNWRELTEDKTLDQHCNVAMRYWPATYYMKSKDAGKATGYTAEPVEAKNACGDGCSLWKFRIAEGNYGTPEQYQAALQNFANWFSFYGSRNRAMKAALSIAFERTELMRVGMFTINPTSYPAKVNMLDMSQAGEKATLYREHILKLNNSGGTPNRFAVRHIGEQFMRKETDDDPNPPVKYACQINAGMLFTDGYSNSDGPQTGSNDANFPYPLADEYPDTLADTAAYYYTTNLRDDLPMGKVPVPDACTSTPDDPKLDCNKNPHMNFYGVTLGAKGDIYGRIYDPIAKLPDPYTGSWLKWGPRQNDAPSTVDEIWHATMNARGKFINATTPQDITNAMREILASVGAVKTPSGTIGLVGARVGSNTLSVEPSYEAANSGTDWFSYLNAYTAEHNPTAGTITFTKKWEASEQLNGAARNISFGVTLPGGGPKPEVRDFQAGSIGADDATVLAALCSDELQNCAGKFGRIKDGVTASEAIAYLRGDRSLDGGKLRKRTTLLGDIVNSSPIVSSRGDDYGYRALTSTGGAMDVYKYGEYLKTKRDSKREPMVYVGANDGMFHAFDGGTGKEKFAYIPSTAIGHMGNLLFPYNADDKNDQVFQHRYYVDGQVTVSDAYLGSNWKTVVVGSVGAGGRSVFGIDVSNTDSLNLLWEINDRVANGGKDIGSVLGKVSIVPVKDSAGTVTWKAIFGNGYNSANGKAVLFLVDIADGKVTTIAAEETGANKPTRTKNGLGNVVVIDRYQGTTATVARDGYADTVYAGDLNGAVWKFDLRSNKVALGGKPLFVARYQDDYKNRQPILGGLEATLSGSDVMIYFGTGSFSFTEDPTNKEVQSIYGILDRGVAIAGRSELQQQFIVQEATTDGNLVRKVTDRRMDATKKGWFINLGVDTAQTGTPTSTTGERFVGNPRLQNGILFFPTYDPTTLDGCMPEGNNWLYGLDALSGAAGLVNARYNSASGKKFGEEVGAVKLKGQGAGKSTAPVKDVAVVASSKADILPASVTDPDAIKDAIAAKCSLMVQSGGSVPIYLPRPCGRQSWRQIR